MVAGNVRMVMMCGGVYNLRQMPAMQLVLQ